MATIQRLKKNGLKIGFDKRFRYLEKKKDDLKKSMIYTTFNCAPLAFKRIRQDKPVFRLVSFFALAQGYMLYNRFMTYTLAQQDIIDPRRI